MKPEPKKHTTRVKRTLIEMMHEDEPQDIVKLRTKLWNIEALRSKGMSVDMLYQKFGNKSLDNYVSNVDLFSDRYWLKHEKQSLKSGKKSEKEYELYLSAQQPKKFPTEFFDETGYNPLA
jgi:hypothetical protein